MLITGRFESVVKVALQSFDGVFAAIVVLKVSEVHFAVMFVSNEPRESQIDHGHVWEGRSMEQVLEG
jgi:hypothetical protein